MRIKLIQKDIDEGLPSAPYDCPVSLAIFRETGRKLPVSWYAVWIPTEKSNNPHDRRQVLLPEEATRFIQDFDAHKQVVPFEFELELK